MVIPDTVTYIGENAFFNCIIGSNLRLPTNLKYLGPLAFAKNPISEQVALPPLLEEVHSNAFGLLQKQVEMVEQILVLLRQPKCCVRKLFIECTDPDMDDTPEKARMIQQLTNALQHCTTIEEIDLTRKFLPTNN